MADRAAGAAQDAMDRAKEVLPMDARPIDELIVADHNSLRELYARYEKSPSEMDKLAILNEYIRETALHSVAEEMILYPKLESLTDAHIDVDHLRAEHQKVKEGLYRVDQLMSAKGEGSRSADVKGVVGEVMRELQAHMKTEEQSDLVRLRKEVDDEARKRMGMMFSFAKTHIPTRPHPSAPDTGGFREMMAGLPAAMMDRLRDMNREFAERKVK